MSDPTRPDAPMNHDIVAMLDAGRTVRSVTESVGGTLGYAAAELVGTDVLALVHPADRERVAGVLEGLRAGSGTGAVMEFRCRHRDGRWLHFRATGAHLSADSGDARTVFTARDITGLRQHDERLRLLESVATHANDAILITDAEPIEEPGPRILYANPAFLRTTGYTLGEVIGKTPRILHGPGTDPEPRRKIRSALKRWKPVQVELLNYRKDGSTFWVELSIVPVCDPTGWFTHWVSIQRDITGRKEAEEALRAAKDEAEAANRAKSEFLSRMSHELRTPLNGILGFAQILQMDPAAAAHRGIADDLYDAGRRLLGLINEVLDISRVEAGEMPLSPEPVRLAELVREGLALIGPMAAARGVAARAEFADPAACVRADRQRLGQVLLNLLSNAVKYNRAGGAITVATGAAGGGRTRVSVSDTGPGIPPEKMDRLFTPFDRLGAEATGVEGTGLGLALSQKLVRAMGGTIAARSECGSGTTFAFELPACELPALAARPPSHADLLLPSGDHLVLYVEDNPANFRLIELALAHRPGVRLMAAMQGGLGVDLAVQHVPDLVLLDLHLPDIPGEEVFRRLRDHPATAGVPVVVLSADATAGRSARLRADGAFDYLTKPLDLREFLRVLDGALARKPQENHP